MATTKGWRNSPLTARPSRAVWTGFAGLCLLSGSRWLVQAALPPVLPDGPRASLHEGLLALVFGVVVLLRKQRLPGWALVAWSMAVFALPQLIAMWCGNRIPGLTVELAFLLLPVGAIFALSQGSGFGQESDSRSLMVPALLALGGAMLLVPWALPPSWAGRGALAVLCGAVLLAGWATVSLHRRLPPYSVLPVAAATASGWAALAALNNDWHWTGGVTSQEWAAEAAVALLLDGPILLLGVWLAREMAPVRFTARVPLILLVAIAESFAAVRPGGNWTMAAGALLLAGGAAYLLWQGAPE